jgi:hypothetical protein
MTNQNVLPLEACDVRNSEDCLLFTPAGVCSTFYQDDEDGNVVEQFCCPKCDPPLTEEEAEQMRREYVESYEAALVDGCLDDAEYFKEQIAEIDADTRRA